MADHGLALEVAKQWVEKQGWDQNVYTIRKSPMQSCFPGYVQIDVLYTPKIEGDMDSDDERDLHRKSRLLEINCRAKRVEEALAARKYDQLEKELDLEKTRMRNELLQDKLDNPDQDWGDQKPDDLAEREADEAADSKEEENEGSGGDGDAVQQEEAT